MFLDRQDQHSKNSILPKAFYRFNAISIKILTQFFTDLERIILNFIWKNKRHKIAKTTLYNKGTSGGIISRDFKLYYKMIVLRTAWYRNKYRRGDQWNKVTNPDINPHTYKHLILDKEAKLYNGINKSSPTNGAGITGCWNVEDCRQIHDYSHAQNLSPNDSKTST